MRPPSTSTTEDPHRRGSRTLPWIALALAFCLGSGASSQVFPSPQLPTDVRAQGLVTEFKRRMESKDPAVRAKAVVDLATASQRESKLRYSRSIAEALALGLQDSSKEVVLASIESLRDRHAPTAIRALGEFVTSRGAAITKAAGRLVGRDLEEFLKQPVEAYTSGFGVLATYRSPKGLAILTDELKASADSVAVWLVLRKCRLKLVDAILAHGCRAAAESVVQHMKTSLALVEREYQVELHVRLTGFCSERGLEPVPVMEDYSVAWSHWLQRNRNQLPREPVDPSDVEAAPSEPGNP